jgi:hypothetical protein
MGKMFIGYTSLKLLFLGGDIFYVGNVLNGIQKYYSYGITFGTQ